MNNLVYRKGPVPDGKPPSPFGTVTPGSLDGIMYYNIVSGTTGTADSLSVGETTTKTTTELLGLFRGVYFDVASPGTYRFRVLEASTDLRFRSTSVAGLVTGVPSPAESIDEVVVEALAGDIFEPRCKTVKVGGVIKIRFYYEYYYRVYTTLDENMKPNSVNGLPGSVIPAGSKIWYRNGTIHRDGAPAIVNGLSNWWYRDGVLHRDGDLPAVTIYSDGETRKEWWIDGVNRRTTPDTPTILTITSNDVVVLEEYSTFLPRNRTVEVEFIGFVASPDNSPVMYSRVAVEETDSIAIGDVLFFIHPTDGIVTRTALTVGLPANGSRAIELEAPIATSSRTILLSGIFTPGSKRQKEDIVYHRENNPAIISRRKNGEVINRAWYIAGKLYRRDETMPALEKINPGSKRHKEFVKLIFNPDTDSKDASRDYVTSRIEDTDSKERIIYESYHSTAWEYRGRLHRAGDLPAVTEYTYNDTTGASVVVRREWWLNGELGRSNSQLPVAEFFDTKGVLLRKINLVNEVPVIVTIDDTTLDEEYTTFLPRNYNREVRFAGFEASTTNGPTAYSSVVIDDILTLTPSHTLRFVHITEGIIDRRVISVGDPVNGTRTVVVSSPILTTLNRILLAGSFIGGDTDEPRAEEIVLHREGNPAVIIKDKDGNVVLNMWYIAGKLYRRDETKPALERFLRNKKKAYEFTALVYNPDPDALEYDYVTVKTQTFDRSERLATESFYSTAWEYRGRLHRAGDLPAVTEYTYNETTGASVAVRKEWWLNGMLGREDPTLPLAEYYNEAGELVGRLELVDGKVTRVEV